MTRDSKTFTVETENGISVFIIHHDIDATFHADLKSQIRESMKTEKKVLITLDDDIYMSGATLATMVSFHKMAFIEESRYAILCSRENQYNVFEITKLKRVLPVFQSKEDAIAGLNDDSEKSLCDPNNRKRQK